MDERDLKKLGEDLAESAVRAGVAAKPLKELYRLVKTKPIPFLEAYVERQISRFVGGFNTFGPEVLEVVKKLENKGDLQKVFMYMNMVYGYVRMKKGEMKEGAGGKEGTGWKEKLEPLVADLTSRFGYGGITLEQEAEGLRCTVRLQRFSGNPKQLAIDLYSEAVSHYPELSRGIRFWIERS